MIGGSKKQAIQKQRKLLFAKDIVIKNPVFTKEHIEQFFNLFNLYADNFRKADIQDMLNTARTLGFEKKYKLVYDALVKIADQLKGQWVNFQTFLTLITEKLGNPFSEDGRRAMFCLVDLEAKEKLNLEDLKRISQQLKFNLEENDLQEVINNVAGFNNKQITWEQFNKYINRKVNQKRKF